MQAVPPTNQPNDAGCLAVHRPGPDRLGQGDTDRSSHRRYVQSQQIARGDDHTEAAGNSRAGSCHRPFSPAAGRSVPRTAGIQAPRSGKSRQEHCLETGFSPAAEAMPAIRWDERPSVRASRRNCRYSMPDRYQGGMQRIGFPARTSQRSLPEPVKAPRAIGDLHA
jgi:hypothetical protein